MNDMALKAAGNLLAAKPDHSEDHIRQNVGRLLDSLDIDNVPSHQTGNGPADIFLPRHRTIIEVKAIGLADTPHRNQARRIPETPFGQLQRYVLAESQKALDSLPLDEAPDLPWLGILTDGCIWHVWEFPHDRTDACHSVIDGFRPHTPRSMLERILPLLAREPIGKPLIDIDPVPRFTHFLDRLRNIHAAPMNERLKRTTETKYRLWQDMLRGSGMEPDTEAARIRLFTAHCFLITLARGVVHTLSAPTPPPHRNCWTMGSSPGSWKPRPVSRQPYFFHLTTIFFPLAIFPTR